MFAVVRTGGKQYRVHPGDKIVVEKLDGNAGDKVTLGDVLLAGDGGNLKSTDGLTVAAEIVAIGDHKAEKPAKTAAPKAEASPKAAADKKPAAVAKEKSEVEGSQHQAGEVAGKPTENPAPNNEEAAGAPKAAAKKPAPAKAKGKTPSTENAA